MATRQFESPELENGESLMNTGLTSSDSDERAQSHASAGGRIARAALVVGALFGAVGFLALLSVHYGSKARTVLAQRNLLGLVRFAAQDLHPDNRMHDGNVCIDEEEFHAGLCYAKCSTLTKGKFPHRNNAFECCSVEHCGVQLDKMSIASIIPCHGYDVNSKGGCPEAPGDCLVDEEKFMGICYKKCEILTHGKYTNRVAAATCCKAEGVSCMNPFNDNTNAKFDVGGGAGDHDSSTPRGFHLPLKSMTEEQTEEQRKREPFVAVRASESN